MATIDRDHFLAPNGRLGHWWLPRSEDSDENGQLSALPARRETGILSSSKAGHWELLVSSNRQPGDEPIDEPWAGQLIRREAIWGKTNSGCVSLFDGACLRPRSQITSDTESTWMGNWSVESRSVWVRPEDRARHIEIELDAGAAWCEQTSGTHIDLMDRWDSQEGTFDMPDALVLKARVANAKVQLRRECVPLVATNSFSVRLRTYFTIEDDLSYCEIKEKWVRPLYELLSFCCATNTNVVAVQARDFQSRRSVDVYYPQPLARAGDRSKDGTTNQRVQFAGLAELVATGTDFETLLGTYFGLQSKGFGSVIAFLVDSQGALLDRSVGARFLSAIRSLEAYEKMHQPNQKRVNLKASTKKILDGSGQIGADIERLWSIHGLRSFANSIPELRNEFAAHGRSGDCDRFPTEPENLKLEQHLDALQWLLRWRYVQNFGISTKDAESLVTESTGYKHMIHVLERPETVAGLKLSTTTPDAGAMP